MVDPAEIRAAKDALRTALRARRATRTEAERATTDAARTRHILDFLGDARGLAVASYLSIAPEPDTSELVAALHVAGARVLLPVLGPHADGRKRTQPDWAPYAGPDALRPGLWSIPEPTTPPEGPGALASADVVFVSALAATPTGWRLGVGGGWFDRALAHASPDAVTVALVSADEVLDTLPRDPWDLPIDVIATEAGVSRKVAG